jgi:hypothetical protein
VVQVGQRGDALAAEALDQEFLLMLTRYRWFLLALGALFARTRSFAQAPTPPHPAHGVLVARLEALVADAGKYLQVTASGGVAPVPGVPFPVWVYNVSLAAGAIGGLRLTRDSLTGVLTLPSAPLPPEGLSLYVNGVCQIPGIDCTVNGVTVTPVLDVVVGGRTISKAAEFRDATQIRANYPR